MVAPDRAEFVARGLPGKQPVESSVQCVITRFGLRGSRHLAATYRDYRKVVRQAAGTAGLLRSAFLVEPPHAAVVLSIWAGEDAIPHFGTNVLEHVRVGNRVFGRLAGDAKRGPELWSTTWQLAAVSNNLNWDGWDLRPAIGQIGRGE